MTYLSKTYITDPTSGAQASVTDHLSLQVTPPPDAKSAFGSAITAELKPLINEKFNSFINTNTLYTQNNQSGTITNTDQKAVIACGAAANSSATLISKDTIRYIPGVGTMARFACLYGTGTANNTQIAGIGNSSDGIFFGYNGTSFGVLYRRYGNQEIRTLTITTASSTAENITITLDGDADATVAVTASANKTTTANEIAAHDYSSVGRGWTARAVGDTVIFESWTSAVQTGTYSLSGATTAVGSFAQSSVGAAPTETWTAQASWNGKDILDGNGITGVTLDPTKGNVFQIAFQYLGFGTAFCYIEDPDDGEMHLVHTLEYANANTRPLFGNPSLPFMASSENTSNTSDISIGLSSFGLFHQGLQESVGTRHGVKSSKTGMSPGTPVLSIRCKEVFKSKRNSGKIRILKLSASAENTKAVSIDIYANSTLTNAAFTDSDLGANGMIQYDTTASAYSGGIYLFTVNLGKSGQAYLDLDNGDYETRMIPGAILTAVVNSPAGTPDVNLSYNLVELY